MALRLFTEAQLGELGISGHEVAGDQRHLHASLPLGIELFAGAFLGGRIPVLALLAIRLHPFERLGEFDLVVDTALDAANELGHVNGLDAHAEPFFK